MKLFLLTLICFIALINQTIGANIRGVSCKKCRVPKLQGRNLYLPFCSEDQNGNRMTHPNVCGAICVEEGGSFTKGSCDSCELKCSPVFVPVCNDDQTLLYPNECHAKCAGEENYSDCAGLEFVIPGKTKLPPNRVPEKNLQQPIQQQNKDEDV